MWRALVLVSLITACGKGAPPPPEGAPDSASTTEATTVTTVTSAPPDPQIADTHVAQVAADATAPPRYFLGRLTLPTGIPLKLLVTATSTTTATLDIPLQGLAAGALTDVAIGDDALRFALTPPGAPATATNHFSATRVAGSEPARYDGEVEVAGTRLPVRFEAVAGPEALIAKRPQTPAPPFPYMTEDVRIAVDGAELGCTLTLPTPKAPLTAVLFLTGSGVQDRDETIFDHKPFFVLADALARGGIASLRCDDRGAGQSSGDPQAADATTFVADAEAALKWLRGRVEIAADRIGIIGHSEGGMTAAAVVKKPDHGVAFVVTLAGPALSGRQILVRQNRDLLIQQGVKPEARDALEQAVDAYFVTVEEDRGAEAVSAAAKALAELVAKESPPGAGQDVAMMTANFESLAKLPWLRGFLRARPAEELAGSSVALLALFGDKDVQVHAADNAAALGAAMKAAERTATIEVVEGANHLFQRATTGALAEYDEIEETMAPATIARIVSWIQDLTGATP